MHASISVGYIYMINEMLNMICMHSILMIEDYVVAERVWFVKGLDFG